MAETEVFPVNLTQRRIDLMVFIQEFRDEHGYAPTTRELTQLLGAASVSNTHAHLELLRRGGLVDWSPGLPRTIRITPDGKLRLAQLRVL